MEIFLIIILNLIFLIKSYGEFYKKLGVDPDSSKIKIKKAFREKTIQYHPDKIKDNKEKNSQLFRELTYIYEILIDDELREIYDLEGEIEVKKAKDNKNKINNFNSNEFNEIYTEYFNVENKNNNFEDIFLNTDIIKIENENIFNKNNYFDHTKLIIIYFYHIFDENYIENSIYIINISRKFKEFINFYYVSCHIDFQLCNNLNISTPSLYFYNSKQFSLNNYFKIIKIKNIFNIYNAITHILNQIITFSGQNLLTYDSLVEIINKKDKPKLIIFPNKDYISNDIILISQEFNNYYHIGIVLTTFKLFNYMENIIKHRKNIIFIINNKNEFEFIRNIDLNINRNQLKKALYLFLLLPYDYLHKKEINLKLIEKNNLIEPYLKNGLIIIFICPLSNKEYLKSNLHLFSNDKIEFYLETLNKNIRIKNTEISLKLNDSSDKNKINVLIFYSKTEIYKIFEIELNEIQEFINNILSGIIVL